MSKGQVLTYAFVAYGLSFLMGACSILVDDYQLCIYGLTDAALGAGFLNEWFTRHAHPR